MVRVREYKLCRGCDEPLTHGFEITEGRDYCTACRAEEVET